MAILLWLWYFRNVDTIRCLSKGMEIMMRVSVHEELEV